MRASCVTGDLPRVLGYAATFRVRSSEPSLTGNPNVERTDRFELKQVREILTRLCLLDLVLVISLEEFKNPFFLEARISAACLPVSQRHVRVAGTPIVRRLPDNPG